MAHNDVVAHFDLKQRARFTHTFGEPTVGVRGFGFAAGVVMHEHDAVSCGRNRHAKDFARVGLRFIEAADGDDMVAPHAELGVKHKHREAFAVWTEMRGGGDVSVPVGDGGCGRVHEAQVLGSWTLSHAHHLPLTESATALLLEEAVIKNKLIRCHGIGDEG